MLNRDMRGDSG